MSEEAKTTITAVITEESAGIHVGDKFTKIPNRWIVWAVILFLSGNIGLRYVLPVPGAAAEDTKKQVIKDADLDQKRVVNSDNHKILEYLHDLTGMKTSIDASTTAMNQQAQEIENLATRVGELKDDQRNLTHRVDEFLSKGKGP